MKKKLLAVGVAATLGALGGFSRAALLAPSATPEQPSQRNDDPWLDGGKNRRLRRYRSAQQSPADRVMDRARARRTGRA